MLQVGLKQLTWKFFTSSCNAYQLDVCVRPLSQNATRLLKVTYANLIHPTGQHSEHLLVNAVSSIQALKVDSETPCSPLSAQLTEHTPRTWYTFPILRQEYWG